MSGRVRSCSSYRRELLTEGWEVAVVPAMPAVATGSATPATANAQAPAASPSRDAASLPATPTAEPNWLPATAPGTVASALRAAGQWSFDHPARSFDDDEWVFRRRFKVDSAAVRSAGERLILGFDGLATLAQIWLNGEQLLETNNMFRSYELDITDRAQPVNELVLRFAPLNRFLTARRPRPRWRTPMVSHPQLRWIRTTLLGRTPGWSPPAAAVGPWRPVWLERRASVTISELKLHSALRDQQGELHFCAKISPQAPGAAVESATLTVSRNGRSESASLQIDATTGLIQGQLNIDTVEPWWPHTHGTPALYDASLKLAVSGGDQAEVTLDLGQVGFRTITLNRDNGDFALSVNGVQVFCRGAVWTPPDVVSLNASEADYLEVLEQVRAAGMNMLRLAGPFTYESNDFLALCDRLGILIWHDFMFSNMDYPAGDAAFAANVEIEARQVLQRLQARPSLALLCGNSEVYQQAAMSGAGRDQWAPALFEIVLSGYAHEYCPDVPYCPSSTHGGDFPFLPAEGTTSYYGVGAYLQPITDARRSEVKFASECLALANVPEADTLANLHFNQPRWRERAPRDLGGAGWDFDDIRDRYLERLFRLDVPALRYADQDRYLRLSRVTSGEVMSGAFTEWRRAKSVCRGALNLFLRDLWPGAGWGCIDSTGLPKAAYYYLKRTLQPLTLLMTDEGCNGLKLHLVNDSAQAVQGQLQIELYKHSQPVGLPVSKPVSIAPREVLEVNATEVFEGFVDLSYHYRFGPPPYDVMRAALLQSQDAQVEAFHFPTGLPNSQGDVGLSAVARQVEGGIVIDIETRAFAQSVHIEAPGYVADDQYFHLAPRGRRRIQLTARPGLARPGLTRPGLTRPGQSDEPFEATLYALNAPASQRVVLTHD